MTRAVDDDPGNDGGADRGGAPRGTDLVHVLWRGFGRVRNGARAWLPLCRRESVLGLDRVRARSHGREDQHCPHASSQGAHISSR